MQTDYLTGFVDVIYIFRLFLNSNAQITENIVFNKYF